MAAMEMIHTYSLVPPMICRQWTMTSTVEEERQRHIVYGEAMGILAGDALLNYAFETAVKAFEIAPEKSPSDWKKL